MGMDRRVQKTKQAIYQAYFELLNEDKGKRITVSAITRRANIDRKTFYLHYASTEDIIKEFSKSKVDELIDKVVAQGFPTEMYAEKVFEVFNDMIRENIDYLRSISGSREYEYFFEQIKSLCVARLLEANEKSGTASGADVAIYAEYFISGIISAYVRWIKEEIPCSIEELARSVSVITFGGFQAVLEQN